MERFTKYKRPTVLVEGWKDDKRPSKDEYYLGFAKAAAIRGTCLRRNYGAVIVRKMCSYGKRNTFWSEIRNVSFSSC